MWNHIKQRLYRLLISLLLLTMVSINTSSPYLSTAQAQTEGVNEVQIRVPKATGAFAIFRVQALVTLNDDTPVTFTITDPEGASHTFPALAPGDATLFHDFPLPAGLPAGVTQDSVSIVPPPNLAGDPRRFQYEINLSPNTNTEFAGATCADIMPTPEEFYTITVSAASPQMTGICLNSFDLNTPGSQCINESVIDPTGPFPVADVLIDGSSEVSACGALRPGVSAVLVLDKSGSMSSSTLGGAPRPKINALRDAVTDFVDVWDDLRTLEAADPEAGPPAAADQIGLLFFDGDAHLMNDVGVGDWAGIGTILNPFDSIASDITDHIGAVAPGGLTSIGDGMESADGALAGGVNRRVVLLMSDGQENTTRRIMVDNPANPQQILTFDSGNPAGATALPNQNAYQVYAVTVGTGTAVSADINEDIARATGGFYINSEDDAELLRPFFLELLQNFLRFNSWETLRLVSGAVDFEEPSATEFPIATTTQYLAINLLWNGDLGQLGLIITPPGLDPIPITRPIVIEGTSDSAGPIQFGNGFIRVNVPLLLLKNQQESTAVRALAAADEINLNDLDLTGDWRIAVTLEDRFGDDVGPEPLPFNLAVLGDDLSVKATLDVVGADYLPGDNIVLQAQVTEAGQPLLGLGSNEGDQLVVQLIKPGVAIGDLLASSRANTEQPTQDDPATAADAQLFNLLQEDPAALVRAAETLTLVDDGTNGDATAGDGIYSAQFSANEPGHYNFLFGVEGTTARAGRFSRQQLKTVHVRAVPDPAETEITSAVDGNTLSITLVPRTTFGHQMGPGWANYFWFTTPDGQAFKPTDQNGLYTATLDFTGNAPPPVTLHFLHVSFAVEDAVTPDQLPMPLDESTTLIETVPGTEPNACYQQHIVKRGEGLFAIGARYGVSPVDMLQANPWVKQQYRWYLYPGQQVCIPYNACREQHIVQRKEGLFAIGAKYGVSPVDMLKANPWVKWQYHWYLYPGQQVCIP